MKTTIKNLPDFLSGLMFLLIGATVMVMAGDYNPGTAMRMGPGYFPRLLGGLLALLGTIITAQSLLQTTADGDEKPFPLISVLLTFAAIAVFWVTLATVGKKGYTGLDIPIAVMLALAFFASREMFWVLAGIAAFAVLLQPMGIVVATFALILLSAFASHEFNWKQTLASWAALVVLCLAVFVWGLKLQFPVWPGFITRLMQ